MIEDFQYPSYLDDVGLSAPQDSIPLDQVSRILIIKFRHLGDVLLSSAMVSILKKNAPRYKASKPDLDNLEKFVGDALESVYWKNDSQIVKCPSVKIYSENPRVEIVIEEIG